MTEQRDADLYLYQRAEAELRMARQARAPEAMQAHQQLASLYLDRFYNRYTTRPARDDR